MNLEAAEFEVMNIDCAGMEGGWKQRESYSEDPWVKLLPHSKENFLDEHGSCERGLDPPLDEVGSMWSKGTCEHDPDAGNNCFIWSWSWEQQPSMEKFEVNLDK